ncbi:MAG: protein nirF [Nitrospinota bacterium]|nr:protein nirF [Nitrospinota bacterium]
MRSLRLVTAFLLALAAAGPMALGADWGTGALMVIIERESSSLLVVDSVHGHKVLGRVEGLGVLQHASITFSRDGRFAYVISRDSLLSKVDLLTMKLAAQVKTGESAVGLAVTQDGLHIAVSNYKPPGVVIVRDDDFTIAKSIPTGGKTVGLVDAPDNLLIVADMEKDSIMAIDAGDPDFPIVKKFDNVGEEPYDGVLTPDARYYVAGFFLSPWMGLLDLWKMDKVEKIPLPARDDITGAAPVLKVPHLEGWFDAGGFLFAPIVGGEGLAIIDAASWKTVGVIPLRAHPIFALVRPDQRQIWVNYAMGEFHDTVDIIDVQKREVIKTLKPGGKVFHLQFTPKGMAAYVSSYADNKVLVYDTKTFEVIASIAARGPSGIFCSDRSSKFGL